MTSFVLAFAFVLGCSSLASAALTFTEDFSSNTIGPNLQVTSVNNQVTFAGGNAVFNGSGDAGRAYIGTVDTDYALTPFTAFVTITVQGAADTNNLSHIWGMGPGIEGAGNGGAPSYDEPATGPAIYALVRGVTSQVGDFNVGTNNGVSSNAGITVAAGAGTHRLRMDYDGLNLSFYVQKNMTGSFDLIATRDASNNGFDSTNSRIFFGASNSRAFDDFSVTAIPEPSTWALGVIGLCALFTFRRRGQAA